MKRSSLALLAPLLLLTTPLRAQSTDRALQDEMSFARELAVRYQYIDLAESVLGALAAERLNDKQKEKLALVTSQVYTEGAKREGNPTTRLEIFDKASDSFRKFFEDHPFSELLPEAESSYMGLVNNYGRSLELALEDALGDESEALRAKIKTVLDEGLERTSSLIDAYDRPNLTAAEKLDKWRLMLDRAQMLITLANVTPDPDFLFSTAQKLLERLATEAGETSGPGLNAFIALAKLYRSRGSYSEAATFAGFVVNFSVPKNFDVPDWNDLPFEVKAQRFRLVEVAMPDLLESLSADEETADACMWSLYFFNSWKREGFSISPLGYLALLSAARTLLDAGGFVGGALNQGDLRWFETEEEMNKAGYSARNSRSALELALSTAQEVNDANKGNTLQVRAQKLISDVISRPGVSVPPDVLFEAAQGEYNTKNYAAAVDSLKQVLRALDNRDDATRREYMPKVLFQLGLTYGRMDRPLEAAMSYRDVATTWSGDPEYDLKAAQGFYREIGTVRRGAGGDPLIEQQFLLGESLITKMAEGEGGSADNVKWRQAERKYDKKDYDGAREAYLSVGAGADQHEKAIVKGGLCLYKKGDRAGARTDFKQYLESFVPDPRNAISGARKLASREEASAQATYYLGKMAFDAQDYDEVLAVLSNYEKTFPTQNEYGPNALYMVVLAHIAKKDMPAARKVSATMQEAFPTHGATGRTAFNIYQALKVEMDAAESAGDKQRTLSLKRDMAHFIQVSNKTSSEPSFAALRVESSLWLDLGEWVAAEETLRQTTRSFEADKERNEDMERFVKPDLGRALLGQKRVPEAFAVLDPLIPKDDSDTRKPASDVVHDWCRSVAGWIESSGTEVAQIPGVGGDYALVVDYLGKLQNAEKASNEAWSCPWYTLKFDQIYAMFQWSKEDSSQEARAKRVLDDIISQLGDSEFKDVGEKCGNDSLQQQFRWIRTELR